MKIKIVEGAMSELDIDLQSDYNDREFLVGPVISKKSLIDKFEEYVNHGRSPARICIDGRMIRPSMIKRMVKSFRKIPGNESFELRTTTKYVNGETAEYIVDPKYDI